MGTRRARRGGGFTLPELTVVIVITAIIAASAAPSLVNLSDSRAALAGRQALRDLTFARQRAIATGTPAWVVFDASAETWSVMSENPNSPGRAGATTLNDLATGRPYIQALNAGAFPGVQIVSVDIAGAAEVGFDWLGRPLNSAGNPLASQGTVTLTGGHAITIEPGTGYVRYQAP
jgi:prepilin-type N-terminal cleavage/methylation domain-containing protein